MGGVGLVGVVVVWQFNGKFGLIEYRICWFEFIIEFVFVVREGVFLFSKFVYDEFNIYVNVFVINLWFLYEMNILDMF